MIRIMRAVAFAATLCLAGVALSGCAASAPAQLTVRTTWAYEVARVGRTKSRETTTARDAQSPGRGGTLRGVTLRGQVAGLHSARRGSYRIIYHIDDELQRIDVVHIDHRGDVD